MLGESNLTKLIQQMEPLLNKGEFVFVSVEKSNDILREDILCEFKEKEGITLILNRKKADDLKLSYTYIASWITLKIHSSLEAVGLTAAFSSELTKYNISCNVVAGFYHDHIFIDVKNTLKAMNVLTDFSNSY